MIEIRFYASAYDRINDSIHWSLCDVRALVFLEAKRDHTFLHGSDMCCIRSVCTQFNIALAAYFFSSASSFFLFAIYCE